ncbi:hypothetical protein D3C85_1472690 [compost metagenome]
MLFQVYGSIKLLLQPVRHMIRQGHQNHKSLVFNGFFTVRQQRERLAGQGIGLREAR